MNANWVSNMYGDFDLYEGRDRIATVWRKLDLPPGSPKWCAVLWGSYAEGVDTARYLDTAEEARAYCEAVYKLR